MSEHVLPIRIYLYTFIALMALMALTAFLSTVPMGRELNTIVALFIAAVKATLVLALLYAPEIRELRAEHGGIRGRSVRLIDSLSD